MVDGEEISVRRCPLTATKVVRFSQTPYSPPSGFWGQFTLWNSNGLKHSWTEVKPVWRTRLLSDALVSQNERGLSSELHFAASFSSAVAFHVVFVGVGTPMGVPIPSNS